MINSSKGFSASVACTNADAEYSLALPAGTRQVQIRSSDTAGTWRWSFAPGVVAGGGGMPMLAAEVQAFDLTSAPLGKAQLIYFAVDATATMQFGGIVGGV